MLENVSTATPDPAAQSGLSHEDHTIVDQVEERLADALALKRWWDTTDTEDTYTECFNLSSTFNRPDRSFGFFGTAEVAGKELPIMGNVQEQFFDRPKTPVARFPGGDRERVERDTARWMREQMREFVLRYFLRVSDFSQPQAFPDEKPEELPRYLRPLSWCPDNARRNQGFGFSQVYYKRTGTGEVGKFAEEEQHAIVDLREIGVLYDWIVLKVDIFNFNFILAPLGQQQPFGTVPLTEESYLVLSRDFVLEQDDPPGSGDIGRYGFGYAFLRDTSDSVLAYGPGRFSAAFQTLQFHVRKNGEVISRMAFVANRPDRVVNVSIDPVRWGLRAADFFSFGVASSLLGPVKDLWARLPRLGMVDPVSAYISAVDVATRGAAARQLCISKRQLEKTFLVQHFAQHYNVVAGALLTWRQIPDWLERDALPEWVKTGASV